MAKSQLPNRPILAVDEPKNRSVLIVRKRNHNRYALNLTEPPISSVIQKKQTVINLPLSMTEPVTVKKCKGRARHIPES